MVFLIQDHASARYSHEQKKLEEKVFQDEEELVHLITLVVVDEDVVVHHSDDTFQKGDHHSGDPSLLVPCDDMDEDILRKQVEVGQIEVHIHHNVIHNLPHIHWVGEDNCNDQDAPCRPKVVAVAGCLDNQGKVVFLRWVDNNPGEVVHV